MSDSDQEWQRQRRIAYANGVSIDQVPTADQLAAQRARRDDADRAAIAAFIAARAAAEAEQAAADAEQERQQRLAAYDSLDARISAALHQQTGADQGR
jgi:hypothetical protein